MLDYESKIELVPIIANQVEQCRLSLLHSAIEEIAVARGQTPKLSYSLTILEEETLEPVHVDYDDYPDILLLSPESDNQSPNAAAHPNLSTEKSFELKKGP